VGSGDEPTQLLPRARAAGLEMQKVWPDPTAAPAKEGLKRLEYTYTVLLKTIYIMFLFLFSSPHARKGKRSIIRMSMGKASKYKCRVK
jgi:hypothetical protein